MLELCKNWYKIYKRDNIKLYEKILKWVNFYIEMCKNIDIIFNKKIILKLYEK